MVYFSFFLLPLIETQPQVESVVTTFLGGAGGWETVCKSESVISSCTISIITFPTTTLPSTHTEELKRATYNPWPACMSACAMPSTPTWDRTHGIDTPSPSSTHCPHNASHKLIYHALPCQSAKFYRQCTSRRGVQSANQSVSQASSQSDSQSGKQAGRQKHTVWVFSVADLASSSGENWCCQIKQRSNGNAPNRRRAGRRFDFQPSDRRWCRPTDHLCPILSSFKPR